MMEWKNALLQLTLLVKIFIAVVIPNNSYAASLSSWHELNLAHSEFQTLRSTNAQQGNKLLLIDGSNLEFPEIDHYYYSYFKPEGFLYQTIKADQYRGKHLHISTFLRGLSPDFSILEKQFQEHYSFKFKKLYQEMAGLMDETEYKEYIDDVISNDLGLSVHQFSRDIRQSSKTAHYGI